ncbi:MAG: ABC transporter permease [Clostridium sp.]|nr:ABC transporter permease [Clostridium sp.]
MNAGKEAFYMINNNGASIRKLSRRSLQNNRMRNIFAIVAIMLTGILFTAVFSLTSGIIQMTQESTMREVGTKMHAGLKAATKEQYEKVIADPMVKSSSYNIYIGMADNILKRQAELRYVPDEKTLDTMFITLEEGRLPAAENEIVVDTFIFDELHLPHALSEKVPITFTFMGETIEEEFIVSGWYQGDYVSHASELCLSESYWTKLKGSLTDDDFLAWGEEHPDDANAGLYAVNIFFDNASNLEDKIRTVIQNAGYDPDTELRYGVNWAYMGNRVESIDMLSVMVLLGAVIIILITGYLIIYNIFQISVINDIRFYGLLKTIGTTKKQIRRLLLRQAAVLSIIGIPVGILIGFCIGKFALPLVSSIGDFSGASASLHFNVWIPIFSVLFCGLTVFLSCRKPGKIAGSVSPIEAVKYTEVSNMKKGASKKKKKSSRFSAVSMALSNLGRSRRTTIVVISAISFSIILLAIVVTGVQSFQIESYLEGRIAGDFQLGNVNFTADAKTNEYDIEPEYLALADSQEGIESRTEMWFRYTCFLNMNEKAMEQFRKLDAEGRLWRDSYTSHTLDRMLRGEEQLGHNFYGYSEELLSQLTVLEGSLDIDKFLSGDYVLLTQMLGSDDFIPADEHVYHPGDKVSIDFFTDDSESYAITDEAGDPIDVRYENLLTKEYEVMAIVGRPSSMNLPFYYPNHCDVILPLSELTFDNSDRCHCFSVSYQIEDDKQAAFAQAIESYSDAHAMMGYISMDTLRESFENMTMVIAAVGTTLAAVVGLIAILNFINAMVTEIISRKQEFAMLQSIGMTQAQLQKVLIYEGVSYVAVAIIISFVLGSVLSRFILSALNDVISAFSYQFQILPFFIMLPLLLIVAALTPLFAWRKIKRQSIVERLRENE